MNRLPNWLLASGALFAIGGMLLLAAGLGPAGEETAVVGGAIMFSSGILIVAFGIYMKARALQIKSEQPSNPQRRRDRCEACEADSASIRCSLHDIKLCTNCMPHHDIDACSYVPLSRKVAVSMGR